jgi:hypothetical protein
MGTIVSPLNGTSFYHGSTIPVVYRSDAVGFDCVLLGSVCEIDYFVDGLSATGWTPVGVSQTGAAPQTQAAQDILLPATGATVTVSVLAWGVSGALNDTATAIYNLVAIPVAACTPATLVAGANAQINGTITGALIAGGSARFVWGSPTPTMNIATNYAAGNVSANLAGLMPGTTYFYRLEILDINGAIIATSGQCQLTTAPVVAANVPDADLVKLCSITGVITTCDTTTGADILLVTVSSSDGDVIPADSIEFPSAAGHGVFSQMGFYRSYYADMQGDYLSPQPTSIGGCTSVGTIEVVDQCDDTDGDGLPDKAFRSIISVNGDGAITHLADYEGDLVTSYVPVAPVDCIQSSLVQKDVTSVVLCDDVVTFVRHFLVDLSGDITILDTEIDGVTPYIAVGTPHVCGNIPSPNPQISSLVTRQTGVGVVSVPVGARSVSVAVTAGNPTVRIGSGAIVTLQRGLSLTLGYRSGEVTRVKLFSIVSSSQGWLGLICISPSLGRCSYVDCCDL